MLTDGQQKRIAAVKAAAMAYSSEEVPETVDDERAFGKAVIRLANQLEDWITYGSAGVPNP